MRRDTFLKSLAAMAAVGSLPVSAQTAALKMMIPANPGGGWDTTGRALGKAMQDAGAASSVSYDNKGGAAGAIGLETMLSAGLRLVHSGEVDLKTLIRAMSTRPAELLGLPGGSLRPGSPADVIVIDLDTPWVLDPADLKSQCKNTPFDEARFSGRVARTIVDGRTVYEHV